MSKSIAKGPIRAHAHKANAMHVQAPPASCVNLALHHFAPECDLVVSGPNIGHNAGR